MNNIFTKHTVTKRHHWKEGRGLEAKFPKRMQHSPSEWQLKPSTFAWGMLESFCHLWCLQCGDPSPSRMTWSEGHRLQKFQRQQEWRNGTHGRWGNCTSWSWSGLLLHTLQRLWWIDGKWQKCSIFQRSNNLPFDQGTMGIPSGRLPSARWL